MSETHFRVLGPLDADVDGTRVALGGPKQRTVLALLLLEANRVVSTDRIVDAVWGDDARAQSTNTLQVYVSTLRRAFASAGDARERFERRGQGYLASVDNEELDLSQFGELVATPRAESDRGSPDGASRALAEALDLWRGKPLADLPDVPLLDQEITRLEQLHRAATSDYVDAELGCGRHAALLPNLEQLVRDNAFDERLRGQLMICLYRVGRQADALGVYREGRELLLDELGIDPGPELQEIERQVLEQAPTLERPGRVIPPTRQTVVATSLATLTDAALVQGDLRTPLQRSVTTIGRDADRDVVIGDDRASRRHAEVRRLGVRYVLVDSGSTNGTHVNGDRIFEHELSDGDELRVGDTFLRFELESSLET